MDRELYNRFNEEVERYRRSLVYYAKAREWETFEKKAGTLFDYVENIELTVLEKKFLRIFWLVLVVLIGTIAVIMKIDENIFPSLVPYKNSIILIALAASGFEIYFFLDFRLYVGAKMAWYKKRRARFIRNIENDFKNFTASPGK